MRSTICVIHAYEPKDWHRDLPRALMCHACSISLSWQAMALQLPYASCHSMTSNRQLLICTKTILHKLWSCQIDLQRIQSGPTEH